MFYLVPPKKFIAKLSNVKGVLKQVKQINSFLQSHHTSYDRSKDVALTCEALFAIDINICEKCGRAVKMIACIEEPVIINKILVHLNYLPKTNDKDALPICGSPPEHVFTDVENY